ncbi:hypothetical protein [uncultured Microbacterium sp.]|uniref:hypothetical protein n=1 Tax=uncultured Microbacterium sp. TaxID=191216 RepID=UPI0028D8A8A1|nr:hypothetical protein [uncultured Microbacterium sp.]
MANGAESWLQAGCRVIRRVAGEGEAPWPGALVAVADGETALAVDAALLGPEWLGWGADPEGHLVAPTDVMRRPDGHDALLPVCTERLGDFLRRRVEGSDLASGEAVTVAVSLLRGIAQIPSEMPEPQGTWWLTESGRPVLATRTQIDDAAPEEGAIAQTALHLRHLAAAVPEMAHVLEEAAVVVRDGRRRGRETERLEAEVFAVAEPLELATTTFGPKRVRARMSIAQTTDVPEAEAAPAPWPLSMARYVDADLSDLVSRATTSVWRGMRARGEGRGRPWAIAATLAAVVLVGGLVWPAGGNGPATAETPVGADGTPAPASTAPTSQPAAPAEGAAAPPSSWSGRDDLSVVTTDLLAARTACGAEAVCLAEVVESPGVQLPGGVIDLPAEDLAITLLDEFGGAAVLRAESVSGASAAQLVVIVRVGDTWLLRDVHDVPQQ